MSRPAMLRRMYHALTGPRAAVGWLALITLPMLYAGRYNHPFYDDYYNALWDGYWHNQRELYLQWGGRYFSNLLVALSPLHWHSWLLNRMAAWAMLAMFAAVMYRSIIRITAALGLAEARARRMIALGGVWVLLNGFSSLAEGFYYFTDAVTYTLPALLGMALLLCCIRVLQAGRAGIGMWLACAALALAVIGSNETLIPLLSPGLGIVAWHHYRQGKRAQARWFALLALACLPGIAAALLAPGNGVRQALIQRNYKIGLVSWLYFPKELFMGWITEPLFVLYSAAVVVLGRNVRMPGRMHLITAFLIPLGIVYACCLPAFWALGRLPPYRAQNVIYIFFLLGWLHFLLRLAAGLRPVLWEKGARHSSILRQLALVTLAVWMLLNLRIESLRISSNYFLLAKGLARHTLSEYDAALRRRYALIQAAPMDTVVLPPLPPALRHGNALYVEDLGSNAADYRNIRYAQFWGKAAIRTDTAGGKR